MAEIWCVGSIEGVEQLYQILLYSDKYGPRYRALKTADQKLSSPNVMLSNILSDTRIRISLDSQEVVS